MATITAPAHRGDTLLQVNTTAPFSVGSWYKLAIMQTPGRRVSCRAAAKAQGPPPSPSPPGRRRLLAKGQQGSLELELGHLFSNPALQAAANAAAQGEWGLLPPGTLPTAATAAQAGATPIPPLLLAAAKYAVAGAYSHWLEEGEQPTSAAGAAGGSGASGAAGVAMAEDGTIDAYLCEWAACSASATQLALLLQAPP